MKSPWASEEENADFIDLMEDYFAKPQEELAKVRLAFAFLGRSNHVDLAIPS